MEYRGDNIMITLTVTAILHAAPRCIIMMLMMRSLVLATTLLYRAKMPRVL